MKKPQQQIRSVIQGGHSWKTKNLNQIWGYDKRKFRRGKNSKEEEKAQKKEHDRQANEQEVKLQELKNDTEQAKTGQAEIKERAIAGNEEELEK